jgi:hypothetical protein
MFEKTKTNLGFFGKYFGYELNYQEKGCPFTNLKIS